MSPLSQREDAVPLFVSSPVSWNNPWHEVHHLAERAGISVEYLCATVAAAVQDISAGKSHPFYTGTVVTSPEELDEVVLAFSDDEFIYDDELDAGTKANWLEFLHPRNLNGRFRSKGGSHKRSRHTGGFYSTGHNFTNRSLTSEEVDALVPVAPHPFAATGIPVSTSLIIASPRSQFAQSVFDAIAKVHGDGKRPDVPIMRAILPGKKRAKYTFPKTKESWQDRRIDVSVDAQNPELEVLYEIGHQLDHDGLEISDPNSTIRPQGSAGFFSAGLHLNEPTEFQRAELQDLHHAITQSDTYQQLVWASQNKELTDPHTGKSYTIESGPLEEALLPQEIFSRIYARYIATRSGDYALREQLAARLLPTEPEKPEAPSFSLPIHWPPEDFQPIAQALDKLFLDQKWIRPLPNPD